VAACDVGRLNGKIGGISWLYSRTWVFAKKIVERGLSFLGIQFSQTFFMGIKIAKL
jgi:hypothetical protein